MYDVSRDLFKFWEISDNISLTMQNRDTVAIEQEQEIVCGLSIGTLSIPLNALESHLCWLKPI